MNLGRGQLHRGGPPPLPRTFVVPNRARTSSIEPARPSTPKQPPAEVGVAARIADLLTERRSSVSSSAWLGGRSLRAGKSNGGRVGTAVAGCASQSRVGCCDRCQRSELRACSDLAVRVGGSGACVQTTVAGSIRSARRLHISLGSLPVNPAHMRMASLNEPNTDSHQGARLNAIVAPYRGPDNRRAVSQLLLTACGFFVSWYLALVSMEIHYGLTLLIIVPTSGFLIRLFMIQHDCGHGSFFSSRRVASFVGHWIGVLTLLPYAYWRRTHALHHAHSGDLGLRGFGDIETLTVNEYLEKSWSGRLAYRIYRNPLVLFGLGAVFHFVVKQRYPWNLPRSWKREWRSVWLTNLSILSVVAVMVFLIGWKALLLVHGPIVALTCSVGVWLFYVQHQFEDTYWERKPDWDFYDAALKGSSHLVLPAPLQWFTASIGLHHIHHLSPKIPNYRLAQCLGAHPELEAATRVTIRDTWTLVRLHLWDAEGGRLVAFNEVGSTRLL